MGKIWMPGSGGPDLDPITVTAPEILAGKVIVDKDGNPLIGTMTNHGAITQTLNAGGSYTIPSGYHNGSGKVTANSLSSQTSATATASQILSGQTAWVNGSKITGTIGSMAGQTIAPKASQQTIASSGKYMTGNVVVNGVSNLTAANIKKGAVVGGVTGTWEGWVPTSNDLYLRGNNVADLKIGNAYATNTTFESGGIQVNNNGVKLEMTTPINFASYNYLNVEMRYDGCSGLRPDAANKDWPTRNPYLVIGMGSKPSGNLVRYFLPNSYVTNQFDDQYPWFVANNLLTTDSRAISVPNSPYIGTGTNYTLSASIYDNNLTIATSIYVGVYYEAYRYYSDGPDYWGQETFEYFTGWIYRIWLS
ncbi:MAG: hypothetical protein LBQ71_15010 [Hungatella sp.]|jgi:hypothetical protein|nr:hypothetical protein [Hungatella sp.]